MRAAVASLLLLGLVIGCSDSTPTGGTSKTSKVAPALTKDKDSGTNDPVPTKSDEKAVALVEEAIKAHGGMDALAKARSFERSVKGTASNPNVGGAESSFTAETAFQAPDHFRHVVSIDSGEQAKAITIVLKGDQGWQTITGETEPLPEQIVNTYRDQCYAWTAITLLPLRDQDVTLVSLPDDVIDGKPVSVVRAVKKGRPDLRLFFDKATGLLVKITYGSGLGGAQTRMELTLLDHKEVDGAKVAHHQIEYLNGAKMLDFTIQNIRLGRKFDGGLFGKP